MNVDENIKLIQFSQNLITIKELGKDFISKDIQSKKEYLRQLIFLLVQIHPKQEDIDKAIDLTGMKRTYTPFVMIKKGISQSSLDAMINLPDHEVDKVFYLFAALYKVAYEREKNKINNQDNPYKWWFSDLSDEEVREKIKRLHNIRIDIKRILHNGFETGSVIIAILPFKLNEFEKVMLEGRLSTYVYNELYPYEGVNIFRSIDKDMVAFTIIKNINELPGDQKKIALY